MNRVMKKTLVLITFLLAFGTMWGQVGTTFFVDSLQYKILSGNYVELSGANNDIVIANIPETVTYDEITYSVKRIVEECFNSLTVQYPNLTSVIIPNSVTKIGDKAFYACEKLQSVTIPNSVTSIGKRAFGECESLTSISLPNNLTKIEAGTFIYCSNLTSIEIPNSVTSIEGNVFENCSSLSSIEIPNSVTSIGYNAFSGCSSLTSIVIPNGVTSIEGGAFSGCSSLSSIVIPSNVTSIGYNAFSGCSSLTSIVIPNGVKSIWSNTFNGCSSLTSIVIPSNVISIGDNAFSGCSKLDELTCIAEIPPTIGNDVFMNTPTNKTLTVICDYLEVYKDSDWDLHFVNIVCENLCNKPTDLSVSTTSPYEATISWNGTADSYEIWLDNNGVIETITETTKTFTELSPDTVYSAMVRAVYSECYSKWDSITFYTKQPCHEPIIIIENVREYEATITWEGSATAYEIQLNDGEIETITENKKTYTNLDPAALYIFRIRSVCGEDFSEWVEEYFETLDDIVVSLNDVDNTIKISGYSNPIEANSTSVINIQELNGKAKLMVIDTQGHIVISEDLIGGTEMYEIKTSGLSAGVYYVAIKTQNGITTEKLIVK